MVVVIVLSAVVGGALLVPFVRPGTLFAFALAGTVVSGHADQIGLPVSPDRMLVLAALGSMMLDVHRGQVSPGRRRVRSVDIVLVIVATAATASAIAAGTITQNASGFALLDSLGIVPFVAFIFADRLFATEEDRRVLIAVMTGVGAYLAATAFCETVGLDALVIPKYILDPNLGLHFGRARGPFLEAAANGMALFQCGAAAAVGALTFRQHRFRVLSLVVSAGCALGVVFAVTRAPWIGAIAGILVGCVLEPRTRRRLVQIMVGVTVLVIAILIAIPGLAGKASDRESGQQPIWDRQNSNAAALRAIEAHPLFGVGWGHFVEINADYERQSDNIPLNAQAARINVHNQALSQLVELGLVGGGLWILAVILAVVAAWRGSAKLSSKWRAATFAIVVDWVIVGSFGPASYAFTNLCTWMWLGLAAAPTARTQLRDREPTNTPVTTSVI